MYRQQTCRNLKFKNIYVEETGFVGGGGMICKWRYKGKCWPLASQHVFFDSTSQPSCRRNGYLLLLNQFVEIRLICWTVKPIHDIRYILFFIRTHERQSPTNNTTKKRNVENKKVVCHTQMNCTQCVVLIENYIFCCTVQVRITSSSLSTRRKKNFLNKRRGKNVNLTLHMRRRVPTFISINFVRVVLASYPPLR